MNYELFYLIGASKEANLDKIKKDVEKIIIESEGVFEELEVQEKKRLAYRVKHETFGFYVARRFEIEPEKLSEINKKLNLCPDVLRFMISKSSDLPKLKIKDSESEIERKHQPTSPKKLKEELPELIKSDISPTKESEKGEVFLEEQKKSDEDIDKKLEEILNI